MDHAQRSRFGVCFMSSIIKDQKKQQRLSGSKERYSLFFRSIDGFMRSIIAIGCIRAWLSAQTGAYPTYGTNAASFFELELFQHISFVILFLFFSCLKFGSRFEKSRHLISLSAGCIAAVIFAVEHYVIQSGSWLNYLFVFLLVIAFVFMVRLWGEDNAESDYRLIIIRIGLSFIAQYIVYTCAYVLPETIRPIFATALPFAIGLLLMKPPALSAFSNANEKSNNNTEFPLAKCIPLIVMVAVFCAGHGILFLSSNEVSGVWTLGSLIISILSVLFAIGLHNEYLFRGVVCAVLFTQCCSALLVLAFPGSVDLISLAKSLSYAISMLLALSIGCRIGVSLPSSRGRATSALMTAYFASFYTAWHIGTLLELDTLISVLIVIIFLVVAALLMIINDWTSVFAQGAQQLQQPNLSDEKIREIQSRLTHSAGLTPRESEVLTCLLADLSVKEIAQKSHISTNTVRTQVQSVYRKLDIHSREDLKSLIHNEFSRAVHFCEAKS